MVKALVACLVAAAAALVVACGLPAPGTAAPAPPSVESFAVVSPRGAHAPVGAPPVYLVDPVFRVRATVRDAERLEVYLTHPRTGHAATVVGRPDRDGVVVLELALPRAGTTYNVRGRAIPRADGAAAAATRTLLVEAAAPGLVVEEHVVVSVGVDAPDHPAYGDWLGPDVLARRRGWREPDPIATADAANAALAPFGYRFVVKPATESGRPPFDLLRGDAVVAADVPFVRPVAVSASGAAFALVVDALHEPPRLIRPDRDEPWEPLRHAGVAPIFVGEELLSVDVEDARGLAVRGAGRTLYRVAADEPWLTDPVAGFWSWGGRWVLELPGQVVVDGESLGRRHGYDEVFGWRLLAGQPLYFFRRADRVGVSYAGEELPTAYEEVVRGRCCEAAAYNARGNESMVWFHARRGDAWLYVEIGVYGGTAGSGTPAVPATTGATWPPHAALPAAGVCPLAPGPVVALYLGGSVPEPRCAGVAADQRLRLVNARGTSLRVRLADIDAELAPFDELLVDRPLGHYLAPGVHRVDVSSGGAAELWLAG